MSVWTLFVKSWMVWNCEFNATFFTLLGLLHPWKVSPHMPNRAKASFFNQNLSLPTVCSFHLGKANKWMQEAASEASDDDKAMVKVMKIVSR